MEIIAVKGNLDIMGKRKLAMVVSIVLLLVSVAALAMRGLSFGIDFTGGYLVEVGYPEPAELAPLRSALESGGFEDASVQHFGTVRDVLVRLSPRVGEDSAELSDRVIETLRAQDPSVEMRRVEFVGPQVGEELREQGGLAVVYALACILVYIWLRFEWQFSLGAVAALVHDVVITLGAFGLFQFSFDLSVLAAILAVIGYSLNDTIVVYDRIRENFRRMRKGQPLEIVNASVNQTLSRTIITSLTTLLVLVALLVLGGEVIRGFAVALIIGVLVGTYSSIFVASTSVLGLGISKQALMPVKKEGAELENIP
ncbi:MAG: protein translocase subunit SecF [Gammaproteobacteria bacterium]|nr:protein translocase subunit SecF [Gammaproteobacteria bacterium]